MSLCAFGIHKWRYSAVWDAWRCSHCTRLQEGREMIAELIERLEKADGPDREIDQALWEAVTGECTHRNTHFVYLENDERELECSDCGADTYGKDKWSGLTSSLDAALSLVERKLPGWDVELAIHRAWDGDAAWTHVRITHPDIDLDLDDAASDAPTPALAVCLALVRALQNEGTPQDTQS